VESPGVLNELKTLQRDLETVIAEFEAMVTGPLPEESAFALLRLKLTRASSRKRIFLETIVYPALSDLPEPDREDLRRFRQAGQAQLQRSAEHIATWTMDRIICDWSGYQGISALVRASMRQRQGEERRLLYPMIERTERARAA
jgi:hypothetical protein